MKTILTTVMLLASLCVAGSIFDGPDKDAPKIKSAMARDAMRAYEKAVKDADDACRKAKADAAGKLKSELEKAKGIAMKAGNLEEANAIAAVTEVVAASDSPKTGKYPLVGEWKVVYSNGVEKSYRFSEGGETIVDAKRVGKWKVGGQDQYVVTEGAGTKLFFCAGERVFVEIPTNGKPPELGVGTHFTNANTSR